MDRKEAILRIKEHMKHHGIGKYPHLKLKEALDMAIAALSPPNEPLTLEQLREMDGEPVWGKSLITDKPGEWVIVRVVEMSKAWFIACAGASQGFGDKDTYGITWLAYRCPPEGAKIDN